MRIEYCHLLTRAGAVGGAELRSAWHPSRQQRSTLHERPYETPVPLTFQRNDSGYQLIFTGRHILGPGGARSRKWLLAVTCSADGIVMISQTNPCAACRLEIATRA